MSMQNRSWTELHRHLDISMRLSTLLHMAQVVGIEDDDPMCIEIVVSVSSHASQRTSHLPE